MKRVVSFAASLVAATMGLGGHALAVNAPMVDGTCWSKNVTTSSVDLYCKDLGSKLDIRGTKPQVIHKANFPDDYNFWAGRADQGERPCKITLSGPAFPFGVDNKTCK